MELYLQCELMNLKVNGDNRKVSDVKVEGKASPTCWTQYLVLKKFLK